MLGYTKKKKGFFKELFTEQILLPKETFGSFIIGILGIPFFSCRYNSLLAVMQALLKEWFSLHLNSIIWKNMFFL